MRKIVVVILIFFHLVPAIALSWTSPPRFSNLSVEDGLSQSTVNAICQDLDGSLWVGTNAGLNRYDGYSFTVFTHDPSNPNSISNNLVRCLYCSSSGALWIGTEKGLSRFDSSLLHFENYSAPGGDPVTCIEELSNDILIVGTEGGLFLFDKGSGLFTAVGSTGLNVATLLRIEDRIYIGTSGAGIYLLCNGEVSELPFLRDVGIVQSFYYQSPDFLWVGTEGDGLFRVNLSTGELQQYTSSEGSISSDFVRDIEADTEGRLWIGTFNGLDIYDSEGFTNFRHDPADDNSLSQNSVRYIFKDTQGGMWLGTWFKGLNYYHPLHNRFSSIRSNGRDDSLNDDIINCIVQDEEGLLWIGTNSGGVNRMGSDGRFTHYKLSDRASLGRSPNSNDIKAICTPIGSGKVYVGAHAEGLSIIDKKSGKITRVPDSPANVYAIIPAGDSRALWVGSLNGLYLYEVERGAIHPATIEGDGEKVIFRIKSILRDSSGLLWVGGQEGLSAYKTIGQGKLEAIRLHSENSPEYVQCLHEGDDGLIWIGTKEGLYCYDKNERSYIFYGKRDGLLCESISGIEEDRSGTLWISTDKGIFRFNFEEGIVRKFSVLDGLPTNLFNPEAHAVLSDGRICFGSVRGITILHPDEMVDNPYSPRPFISWMTVFGNAVRPGDDTGILKQDIRHCEEIVLHSRYTSFSLGFSVTNFIAGGNNHFSYILEGFDKDWQDGTAAMSARYANLRPGNYVFFVKAANNDGIWSGEPAMLSIRVLPAWYNTFWFKFALILAGICLMWLVIRFMVERMNMQKEVELEKKERRHQEEINEMKISFFVNMSHEFRSPLTLMLNTLQDVMGRTEGTWMKRQLWQLQGHTNRLLRMANQLIDFRRAELGVFRLNVHLENVHKLVEENFRYYENFAKARRICYTLESSISGERHYADPEYLQIIENNLLSNAFKYTQEGNITVKLEMKENELLMEVKDTGTGIPKEKQEKIFQRFYQIDGLHGGSGIGLSLVQRLVHLHHGRVELDSAPGKGSAFRIFLPQSLDVYSEEELASERDEFSTIPPQEALLSEYGEIVPSQGDRKWTVLVAEDDEALRKYLELRLSEDFSVVTVSDGEAALATVRKGGISAIVTDVVMPVMDGIALCAAVKKDHSLCHIPVLMLSAKAETKDQLTALDVGADDYLSKPFSATVLSAKLRNALKARERMAESSNQNETNASLVYNKRDEALLLRMVSIVEANMDNVDFSIQNMADALNMSRSNLYIRVKAITGTSAKDFVLKIRLKEACRLIKDGRYSLSQIKDMVGFGSASYFSVCFKKHIGCLPSEYGKE